MRITAIREEIKTIFFLTLLPYIRHLYDFNYMLLINFHWVPFWNLIHLKCKCVHFPMCFVMFFFFAPLYFFFLFMVNESWDCQRLNRHRMKFHCTPAHTHTHKLLALKSSYICRYDIQYFTLQFGFCCCCISIWVFFPFPLVPIGSRFFFGIQQFWFHSFFPLIPALLSNEYLCTVYTFLGWRISNHWYVVFVQTPLSIV